MYRHPKFDLAYTHETVMSDAQAPRKPLSPKRKGLDLTARLRCLKALYDMERGRRLDSGSPVGQ